MDAPKNLGDQIREAVENAINTQDFSVLKDTVSKTLTVASENISRSLSEAAEQAKISQDKVNLETKTYYNASKSKKPSSQKPFAPPTGPQQPRPSLNTPAPNPPASIASIFNNAKWQQNLAAKAANMQLANRYASVSKNKVLGYTLGITGGLVGGGCLLASLICALISAVTWEIGAAAASAICFISAIPFLGMLGVGIHTVGQSNLFKRVQNIIGPKQVYNIKDLAHRLRMKPQKLGKQLDKMLQKGWFREGHVDAKGETLMVTNDAYNQYLHALTLQAETQKQAFLEAQQAKLLQQKAEEAGVAHEIQKMLDQGNSYLAQIKACNAAIPGAEITNKINQIELVVQSIFARAEENPEVVSDLGRLMDYYLPTTVKLLEAYEDLDAQPIQTENILESKRQIEDTLDTLSVAFEKLLDSIFRDTVWDVSTDISVLHTVLAQEGLTDNPFEKRPSNPTSDLPANTSPQLTLDPFGSKSSK